MKFNQQLQRKPAKQRFGYAAYQREDRRGIPHCTFCYSPAKRPSEGGEIPKWLQQWQ
jgi:hypothetical protein